MSEVIGVAEDAELRPRRRRVSESDRQAWQKWQQTRVEDAFADGQRAQSEGRTADALSAFERAHRLSPNDPVLMFALGLARSKSGDLTGSLTLMDRLAETVDMREAWVTAASCARALGQPFQAARYAEHLLATHGFVPSLASLFDGLADAAARPGWCALTGDDPASLVVSASGPVRVVADQSERALGKAERRAGWRQYRLPPDWQEWTSLAVTDAHGAPLLGSPLSPSRIARPAGFVEADGPNRVKGWGWFPSDPERTPVIEVRVATAGGDGALIARLCLDQSADALPGNALARPRRIDFTVPPRWRGTALDFTDEVGRSLLGSPIDSTLLSGRRGVDASPAGQPVGDVPPAVRDRKRPLGVDVVIPVYRHRDRTLACLQSVRDTVGPTVRLVVVDDCSPEHALSAELDRMAQAGAITLLRNARNRGFTHAANRGLALGGARRGQAGRDAVLLNSDTIVAPGWLERLRMAAYAGTARRPVASVTPLSNDATILSYPHHRRGNPMPDRQMTADLAALAARANGDAIVDLPTGVGFCMFMRRDCLDQVGLLREDLFAQGYGEENDWCLRATRAGWRHVAATGVYVAHEGGVSFGDARSFLMARNGALIERWHPGYQRLVDAHVDTDPLADARRRIDRLRLLDALRRKHRSAPVVALVTHDQGGGVENVVRTRIETLAKEGKASLVLRPSSEGGVCVVSDGSDDAYPNLAYRLPDECDALCGLLREVGAEAFEWHHLLGHEPLMRRLPDALGLPYRIVVHDYAAFCPRVTLVSYDRRYCGEPDEAACIACVATLGERIEENISVPDLRRRSRGEFTGASGVLVPSDDVGRRIARHFPGSAIEIAPWEDDRPDLDLATFAQLVRSDGSVGESDSRAVAVLPRTPGRARIVLLGGIGPEKGYDILLECLCCAREQALPLEFVIAGFTPDDARLREAGCGPITGEYRPEELPALLARFEADVAFLPSVCPETWSFTLTEAWRAGLPAVVFDIGTPAERIRRTGRGIVLPVALPAPMICQQLLEVATRSAAQRQRLAKSLVTPQLSRSSSAH